MLFFYIFITSKRWFSLLKAARDYLCNKGHTCAYSVELSSTQAIGDWSPITQLMFGLLFQNETPAVISYSVDLVVSLP